MAVLDSQGMWRQAEGLPEQAQAAVARARGLYGLPDAESIASVVVMGMGGSGFAGEVVLAAAAPQMPVPVVVVKSYECPAFVDDTTLVFAVSASGNTEETIQAASDAAVAGARMVVVTSGGELGRLAGSWGAPVVAVPADIPQPRAAVAALSLPPLVVLEDIGLYKGGSYWIEQAIDQLKRRRDLLVAAGESGPAAEVARRIGDTIPLFHGGGSVGAAAAQRWRTQVNENAKAMAFWAAQPELCHNEVCGWGRQQKLTKETVTAVALRHDGEHPQVSRRFELVAELLGPVVASTIEVRASGDGDLAQLLDLVLFGDYVSLWMAAMAGVDPGPIEVLTTLKARLATGP